MEKIIKYDVLGKRLALKFHNKHEALKAKIEKFEQKRRLLCEKFEHDVQALKDATFGEFDSKNEQYNAMCRVDNAKLAAYSGDIEKIKTKFIGFDKEPSVRNQGE